MKLRLGYRKLLLAVFAVIIIAASCKTHYQPKPTGFTPLKNASVKRGKMLVQSSCAGCHADPQTHHLSGKEYHTPRIYGKVFAANLTQSATHSPLSKYTEAEFAYLMRTGVTKEGEYITYMLRPNMSDEDISAMWAYLHSDDADVRAVNTVKGTTHLNLLGRTGGLFLGKPPAFRVAVPAADQNDAVAYGRYLTDNIGCFHCHSKAGPLSIKYSQPEQTRGYMTGGRKFKMPDGRIRGSNLTPDKETGIGNYTKEEFRRAVLEAQGKDDHHLRPPMKAFHHMTQKESDAIFAYIQTLEPVKHRVN